MQFILIYVSKYLWGFMEGGSLGITEGVGATAHPFGGTGSD